MKVSVKLFPAFDIPKIGMYVKKDNTFHTIASLCSNEGVIIENGEYIAKESIRLHKMYVFSKRKFIGELAFSEYNKVKENQTYEMYVIHKLLAVPIGTKVRVIKINSNMITPNMDIFNLVGEVIAVNHNTYTIKLENAIMVVKRHYFIALDSKNTHSVCYLEK